MKTIVSTAFGQDVLKGLSGPTKSLPSKYFYDDTGSRLFIEIMAMPEYYPTGCELEILMQQSGSIFDKINFTGAFTIVELGSGDGMKTRHLLNRFYEKGGNFTYIPVDISEEAITVLKRNLEGALLHVPIEPYVGDYFEALDTLKSKLLKLILFLGGNVGNYLKEDALALLKKIHASMNSGDMLLMGMDLIKNPRIIQKAYDDPAGITKAFNINLLRRINAELDADIHLDQFDFYSHYNPSNGEVNSYLVSLKKQHFHSTVLDTTFYFEKDELIWTELSKKYSFNEIETLATASGFNVLHNFMDCRHYFTDSLWIKE